MVNTLFLSQNLKELTEKFLKNNPKIEWGGYFLGREYTLLFPLFVPNVSKNPSREYTLDASHTSYLNMFAQLFNFDLVVHFHTHPTHSIASEADLKFSRSSTLIQYYALIIYDENKNSFTWHSYDNSGEEQYLQVLDKQYPLIKEYFAKSLGLFSFGDCYLTVNGEILSNNPLSKAILNVRPDVLKVYNFYKNNKISNMTKKEIANRINISIYTLDNCLKLLNTTGILKKK